MNVFNLTATGSTAGDAVSYTRASADSVLVVTSSVNSRGVIFPADSAISDEITVFHPGDEDITIKVYPSDGAVVNSSQNPSATYVSMSPGGVAHFRMISSTQWVALT